MSSGKWAWRTGRVSAHDDQYKAGAARIVADMRPSKAALMSVVRNKDWRQAPMAVS